MYISKSIETIRKVSRILIKLRQLEELVRNIINMEFNIEVRKNQLVNLEQFISSSRDQVKAILKSFQWSIDKVKKVYIKSKEKLTFNVFLIFMQETTLVSCPIDSNHKMSSKILDKHISKCSLQNEGYDLKEEFLSIPDHKPGQYIQIGNY